VNHQNAAASVRPESGRLQREIHMESRDRLLDAEDVGAWFHVPPSWVRQEARAGRLPSIRLGHYVRFERDAVAAWLEGLKAARK
jgi:excisionase family DNA binding protein